MMSRAKSSCRVCMMIFLSTVASSAALAGQEIEGRWETKTKDLVLDISRCGQQYCGQAVNSNNQCERTVLTVAVNATSQTFGGELAAPGRAKPYKVKLSVTNAERMVIVGDDVEPSLVRRTFPFHALLARAGNASCPSKPTS